MLSIIIFFLILGVIVLIHEFGHFIAAKRNGVRVDEFGWGYPPRIWGIKIGETLYSINLLPLGGFVKVYAEEYHEADEKLKPELKKRAFIFKKPWQKAVILLGGIFMNVIFAVTIFYVLLAGNKFYSEPFTVFTDYRFRFGSQVERVVVANIVKDSPAARAGVEIGDIVQQVRPQEGEWQEVYTAEELIDIVNNSEGVPLAVDFINLRDNQRKTVDITPRFDERLGRAVMGVGLAETVTLYYQQPAEKLTAGFLHGYNITSYSLDTMGYFISSSFREKSIGPVSETVAGPVGIFFLVGQLVDISGGKLLINLANFTAILSLSLAIMNIIPFPALDGGRLVFVIYEWISGRRPNHKVEQYVNFIGFASLICLAVVITINDILKFFR